MRTTAEQQLQSCFILHRRLYRETSMIVDVFSEDEGRISLLAKGVRTPRSKWAGRLQQFTPLLLKWGGKGNLPVIRQVESLSLRLPFTGENLYTALYVNELIERLIEKNTPYPALFHDYLQVLTELAQCEDPQPALRRFELALLQAIGYAVDLLHCSATGELISPTQTYRYRPQQGLVATVYQGHDCFSGASLIALSEGQLNSPQALRDAKRFTRLVLHPHLGEKPLKSRELFTQAQRQPQHHRSELPCKKGPD